jgi:hypothetical protein
MLVGGIIGFFGFTILLFIIYVLLPTKPCPVQPGMLGHVNICHYYKNSFYADFTTFASTVPGIIGVAVGVLLGAVGGRISGS